MTQASISVKQRLTDMEKRLVVAKREARWERRGLGVWD